jgi:hypothetical protein
MTEWNSEGPGEPGASGSENQPPAGQSAFGPAGPVGPEAPYGAPPAGGSGPVGSDAIEFGPSAPAPGSRSRRKGLIVAGSVAAVAAIAVAAVAIAGIGGSSAQTPEQVLATAAHKSAEYTSESATFSEQLSGAESGTISGSAQAIRKPLQMSMTMTENLGGQTLPISAVLTPGTMYMKLGAMAGIPKQIAGKWLALPLTSLGGGSISSLLQSVEKENPASQSQLLLASRNLRADGTQVVDGVQTTRYVGVFTPAAAIKLLAPDVRGELGPALKQVRGNIRFSVWIDGSDQIRKITESEAVGPEQVSIVYTYVSFNQPVTITIPPASQVIHIPISAMNG